MAQSDIAVTPPPTLAREPAATGLEWRTRNVGRLLFEATDVFLRVKLRAVNAGEGPALTEAQSLLLQNLDRDGTRPSRIAARIAAPKQSLSETVDRAEAMGLVERRPDLADGRAKVVALTPAGLLVLERLRLAVQQAERRMAAVVGEEFLQLIKVRLGDYFAAADLSLLAADLTLARGPDGWAGVDMGRLTVLARRAFVADVLRVAREGGADVSEMRLSLFRTIDDAGSRLTDIAARAGMSKQAMAEIVAGAAAAGLVEKRADPGDGRARRVVLTGEGRRLLNLMGRGVAAAEARLAAQTDPAFVEDLRAALRAYVNAETAAGETLRWPSTLQR